MKVFWEENSKTKEEQTGVLDMIGNGRLSIDKAYKLLERKEKKIKEKQVREMKDYEGSISDVSYQLFNKSSMDMSEVADESVRLCIDSHPYFQLREYRHQDELCHGQEETVKEYVSNFVNFCRQKREKLVKGGVLVTIIGETYRDGYKGICTKVETALENDGWIIIDLNIWEKSNGKFTPHPYRFVNVCERIIVARKQGAEPFFQEEMKKSSTEGFKVKPTSSGGYYLATPESCITNLIRTSVHNSKELKVVDEDFQHDAPCPEKVYKKFINSYSQIGETILDSFIGSGTAAVCLSMGRNLIGYDVDPVSIEFSKKRCDKILDERNNSQSKMAA
jgi:DNA modification methylase